MSNLSIGPFSGGNVAVVQDQQTSGTAGDSISTIADQTLNTVVRDQPWMGTLSSDEIPLDAGEYDIMLVDSCKIEAGTSSQFALITDDSNTVLDSALWPVSSSGSSAATVMNHIFNISLSTQTNIKYRCKLLAGTSTRPAHSAGVECYQKLLIKKVG